MRILRTAFGVIKQHKRAFITLNIAFYGLLLVAMIITVILPELQVLALDRANAQLDNTGIGGLVVDAYDSGNILLAITLTFAVNLIIGALLTTTLPSFVIPFFGIAFTFYRVIEWGFLFAPIGLNEVSFIPHVITLIVEGQSYVLAAFAVWVHGRMFLAPHRYKLPSRWAGYKTGLAVTIRLYPLIILVLIVAAIYEAIELICIVPMLVP